MTDGRNHHAACLGTENFKRIRIGVGEKPAKMDLAAYVLSRFGKEDITKIVNAPFPLSRHLKKDRDELKSILDLEALENCNASFSIYSSL